MASWVKTDGMAIYSSQLLRDLADKMDKVPGSFVLFSNMWDTPQIFPGGEQKFTLRERILANQYEYKADRNAKEHDHAYWVAHYGKTAGNKYYSLQRGESWRAPKRKEILSAAHLLQIAGDEKAFRLALADTERM